MTDKRAATAAVLDEMVAGIMGVKAQKAQLTPVGTETAKLAGVPSDLPGAYMSKEGMRDAAQDLRRWAEEMVRIADGLDAFSGFTTDAVIDTAKEDRKVAERAADEKFSDRMDRLKAAAQAATFGDVADEEPPETPESTWSCLTHGSEDIRILKSGSGREYAACGVPNCKHFERKPR